MRYDFLPALGLLRNTIPPRLATLQLQIHGVTHNQERSLSTSRCDTILCVSCFHRSVQHLCDACCCWHAVHQTA